MGRTTAPLLSIGMIFKNEARCLERCLKSLEPLRQAIPCELVMADTGSTDGSRAIAERYADAVFDFAWVDDFSAARNAVMDRCSGKWYFTVDSDEWLDKDITELLVFLQGHKQVDFAFVIQRNYSSKELEQSDSFQDFYALRLIRMAVGERYHGTIHETWYYKEPSGRLFHTVLHHDGYCFESPQQAKKKQRRNMELLRKKLEQEPQRLRTLLQCIESGGSDPELVQYTRHAVDIVKQKCDQWEHYGPCIISQAAEVARVHELSELNDWIEFGCTQFPDSIFTMVDLSSTAFLIAYENEEWEKAIEYGEEYLKGARALHAKNSQVSDELKRSIIRAGQPGSQRAIQIGLANCYLRANQGKKALSLLQLLKGDTLEPGQVRNAVIAFCQIHAETMLDITPSFTELYKQICHKGPKRGSRLATFDTTTAFPFTEAYQKEEREKEHWQRPAYTAFACLADQCEAGRGAKIMLTDDPAEMRKWLLQVENWQALPIEALEHALAAGVTFPLEERSLNREVLDGLAARLTYGANPARQWTLALTGDQTFPSLQRLAWTRALSLAALRSFDWALGKKTEAASEFACPEKPQKDTESPRPKDTPEVGLALLRRFAQIEEVSLPTLYAPQLLTEENAALLPPMHRWGFYCARAFAALDAEDPQGYLAALRKGLAACPGEKGMVQFLLDRFLEDARPKASPELLALADRVRAILAAYSPDDPAVAALRESPAYRQVAWLIDAGPGPGLPDALVQ